ncbi:Activating transcription factor 7-interacting protein 1 [Nibea albiflora]|uniref:Activating transcription factor 7-interacting protein 1 n=1 Tax=Nibea albiflora TaxID=240163 RepID=A0ACB7EZM7_NIBAL|nr:Activating transcription factor 7-interacting protein 1 [Nibea albiflora]
MKRLRSTSASSGAGDKRLKFSQSQVQMLIKQEVLSAVRQNETKMQSLIEAIQQLDHECDYERTFQKLERKKDPPDAQEKENVEDCKKFEEPKAERVKAECISPGHSSSPKHTEAKQDTLPYPRLPPTPLPSNLSTEAALYNIPQRPVVQLALIKNPRSLSLLWKLEEDDPCAPPMDSYSILLTTEKVKGSGIFPKWNTLDEVKAIPLPMCVMVTKFKAGHKVCVAVVGKDKFGRFGPYSKVLTAAIPE